MDPMNCLRRKMFVENMPKLYVSYWLVANRNSSTAYVISPLDKIQKDEHKEETNRDPKFFLPYDEIVKNKKIAITDRTQNSESGCNVCGKQSSNSYSLIRHLQMHTGEKTHECKVGKKGFFSQLELRKHEKFHLKKRPHMCNICKKRIAHSSDLKKHTRIHTGEKPHKCEHCGRGFALSSALTKHIRTHTGERPYECRLCGRHFAQSSTLYSHKQVHIREGFILQNKEQICYWLICHTYFRSGNNLGENKCKILVV